MHETLLIVTNMPDATAARSLARQLVEQRLAACVNCLPGVQSVYRWEGAIEEAPEVSMLIKTTRARYADLEAAILAAHPYRVPEIIAIPVVTGLPAYIDWIAQETKKDINDQTV